MQTVSGETDHEFHSSVTDIGGMDDVFAAMAEHEVPLTLHGEVTDSNIDIFDREAVFIDNILKQL